MVLLFECLLCLILRVTMTTETIAFMAEEDDVEALAICRHLNISRMYHSDSHRIDNITVKHIVITKTTSPNDLCGSISNISLLVSVCKSKRGQQLVRGFSQHSGIPTIHIVRSSWNELRDNPTDGVSKNQIFLVPTVTVFNNVILDILPGLNVSTDTSILFDSPYGDIDTFREVFGMLPVPPTFVQIESGPEKIREQIRFLTSSRRVIIVAATTVVETVVRENSTVENVLV